MDIVFERYEENSDVPRKEIDFILNFEGAIPSKESIKDEISLCYGSSNELIALDKLRTVKGKKKAAGKARIYSDAQIMKRFER